MILNITISLSCIYLIAFFISLSFGVTPISCLSLCREKVSLLSNSHSFFRLTLILSLLQHPFSSDLKKHLSYDYCLIVFRKKITIGWMMFTFSVSRLSSLNLSFIIISSMSKNLRSRREVYRSRPMEPKSLLILSKINGWVKNSYGK